MAYVVARSGLVRANAFHAGLYTRSFGVTVGGTSRPEEVKANGFQINQELGGPSSATVIIEGFTPTELQEIKIYESLPNEVLFAGHIMDIDVMADQELLMFKCECVDYTWLLDRFARVSRLYTNQGIGTIVADILANDTDGGFKVGSIPDTLGTVTMSFEYELVSTAFNRLARAATGDVYWNINPEDKAISFFETITDGNSISLANATDVMGLHYRSSARQVRTRTIVIGKSTQTTALVESGATSVPVEETKEFNATGGKASCLGCLFDYTGIDVGSGPGNLTGVTGITDDIGSGEPIAVAAQADDATAQSALATTLGGGLSGVVTHFIADDQLTEAECINRATADLASYKDPSKELSYQDIRPVANTFLKAGKAITATVTSPLTVNGSFLIRQVGIELTGPNNTRRTVAAGSIPRRRLTDVLEKRREAVN